MKQAILSLLLCSLVLGNSIAQDNPLLFSFFHLKSNEILVGKELRTNDSILLIDEHHLGVVPVNRNSIEHIEHVYSGQLIMFWLSDNAVYRGFIQESSEGEFTILSEMAGKLTLPRSEIIRMELLFEEQHFSKNPNSTRYFFGPSAFPVEKGGGYYQNVYLLMNSVTYGASEHLTVGGGVVIPLLFYGQAKLSYKVAEKVHLGMGVIAGTTVIPDIFVMGALPFGLATFGSTESNVTLGVGYGAAFDGDPYRLDYPIFTLSGMKRLTDKLQLVTENWIIPDKQESFVYDPVTTQETLTVQDEVYVAASVGLRLILGEHASMDFAPVLLSFDELFALPYLDFVYRF